MVFRITNPISETSVPDDNTVNAGENENGYKVRSSNYNKQLNKLNLEIEIELIDERLPTEEELKAISDKVLQTQPKAKMNWVFFLLPKMNSGSGAYATDHRIPEPEGINIQKFSLYNTPYERFLR